MEWKVSEGKRRESKGIGVILITTTSTFGTDPSPLGGGSTNDRAAVGGGGGDQHGGVSSAARAALPHMG